MHGKGGGGGAGQGVSLLLFVVGRLVKEFVAEITSYVMLIDAEGSRVE
jgi:hypothetical protein